MKFRLRWALLVCVLAAIAGGCAQGADFRIRQAYAGPPLVGFGAQMNAFLYCGSNWGPHEANESNIGDLERKVIALHPQHVRIFVQPEWWMGKPDIRKSMMRTLELAKRAGATVNLTYWHGPWPHISAQIADFVKMVGELRGRYGFTNIQYVTVQNEPNGHRFDMQKYVRIYRALDEELRKAGIRDKVKIIGGDLVHNHQADWLEMLSRDLSDVLDGYSIHMYQNYWDLNGQLARVTDVRKLVNELPKRGRKPLYLMEFGLRGVRKTRKEEPGTTRDGRPLYETTELATLQAWRMLEALNRGFIAIVWWDMMDVRYDRSRMYYGLIGEPSKGWPLKPGYRLMSLFTHTCDPGWRTRQVEGSVRDQTVSALAGPHGELTLYELNRDKTSRDLGIAGLPPGTRFRRILWNGQGNGMTRTEGEVESSSLGVVEITAPPSSVTALTTLPDGE